MRGTPAFCKATAIHRLPETLTTRVWRHGQPEPDNTVSESVVIHIDGGSRGNPGPAAAGVVIRDAADQSILYQAGLFLGKATNNVAEYSGLLEGLRKAKELGAKTVEIVSDSELMVRQMNGQYRVKNPGLQELFGQAVKLRQAFAKVTLRHVRREFNKDADALVNQALDLKKNVGDAE